MLSIDDIKALMKAMDVSSISELKFESEDTKITLKKTSAPAASGGKNGRAADERSEPAAAAEVKSEAETDAKETTDDTLHKITAPMVGTFYTASSPDAKPFVQKGSKVDEKTVVCIVEAMKLFNEIEADCKGTIVDILVEDGQLVEYNQPLFLVKED
ncbi:MAG: acetyl-CoA carboxylase biotin carboxyl carrier protein [Sporolactobacillus sp.]|nr:acetyl-CoA carboxylase biotin carboxyl carrier protein [Sporolactobacillus sp.]